MKREMDLVRELLLRIEEFAKPVTSIKLDYLTAHDPRLQVQGYEQVQIAYHISLLVEAGLVNGVRNHVVESQIIIKGVSWRGHEFLDKVRDPAIWHATKEGANKAGGFTIDLLGDLAKGLIKTQIEKHTGVKL